MSRGVIKEYLIVFQTVIDVPFSAQTFFYMGHETLMRSTTPMGIDGYFIEIIGSYWVSRMFGEKFFNLDDRRKPID